jgi:hypothetical protein
LKKWDFPLLHWFGGLAVILVGGLIMRYLFGPLDLVEQLGYMMIGGFSWVVMND